MAESYCGKNCAQCLDKQPANCPGCKVGPGRPVEGDCELAKCCQAKGCETCDTCAMQNNCEILQKREQQSEYRRQKAQAEQTKVHIDATNAAILGK